MRSSRRADITTADGVPHLAAYWTVVHRMLHADSSASALLRSVTLYCMASTCQLRDWGHEAIDDATSAG